MTYFDAAWTKDVMLILLCLTCKHFSHEASFFQKILVCNNKNFTFMLRDVWKKLHECF